MKQTIKCLIAAFAAMLMSVAAFAQVTTSALGGRVVDANGNPVEGMTVVATHTPSGTVYGVTTNEAGRYTINGMRAGGPYSVEFTCVGYQTVTYTDLNLQLAETSSLDAVVNEDKEMLSEAMVVAAAASKFSAQKMGSATNISSVEIISVPTVSRSLTDVTRLSPYGGNGMSFAGADGRTANFTVDGANFNNNFGLSDNLPGGGNPISIDAIEEMQVVISPYDVRQTNFIGGGVNAITKSGTNTFKGSAYVYHRNENMRGNMAAGKEVSGARDKDRNTTYGFTLGGPIVKDKLFFFVNAEYSTIPTVVNRWRGTSKVDENGNGISDPDAYISRTTLKDLADVSKFVKDNYGYDTGSWTDYPATESNLKLLGRIDWNINENHKLAVRYNYTLNQAWNSTNGSSMDGGSRSGFSRFSEYGMAYANSLYSMDNLVSTVSVDLNSRLSDNLSNQFLATYSKLDDMRGTNSSDMPFIDIRKDDGGAVLPYIALGYELFTWNNGVHNTHISIKDDLTYYAGNHKVTAGINYEYQMADNSYMRNGTGYYRYRSLEDFYAGAAPEVVCLTYGYEGEANPAARVQFHKAGIYAQDEWNVNDEFKLTYGLRLDGLFFDNQDLVRNNAIYDLHYGLGECNLVHNAKGEVLRNEQGQYVDADGNVIKDCGNGHIDTGKWPKAAITASPRVGFSWDVFGNNTLKLRGGTGLFSGRLPLVFFTNMPTNSGMVQYQAKLNSDGKNGGVKTDMSQFAGRILKREELHSKLLEMGYPNKISPADGTIPAEISAVDPDFKMPQVWKTSLAIDYNFPTSFPFSISAEGIFNKTVNGVVLRDWSVYSANGFPRLNGADNRPIYQDYQKQYMKWDDKKQELVSTNLPSAYVLENTNQGYGYSGTVTMNMRPIPELSFMAAYTHTVSKEVTGMPGSNASSVLNYMGTVYGPNDPGLHNSQYVTPDRFIASITHNDKSGNHFSLIYETWRGGYNYSYMTANDMNGDGYNYDLIYIPTDEQVANKEFRFVSEGDAARFMDFVHADPYLSKNQGKYAEAYSVYSPWTHRVDFSYKHDFKVKVGKSMNTLQLCLDVKNVLNLFNSDWGVSKYMNPSLGEGRILKYEGYDKDGYATFSTPSAVGTSTKMWVPSIGIGQCWYASIGIKYMFN